MSAGWAIAPHNTRHLDFLQILQTESADIGQGSHRIGGHEFEDRFRDLMKMKPSEYWRRQCKCTFQFDPISTKLIDDIGVETMMWGSDYPHTDGIWPESSKYITGLSPEVIHKITCENAAKFYNLVN